MKARARPQGFLAQFFKRLHANLYKGFDLRLIAGAVGANRFLPHFGKEQRIVAGALGASRATPSCWQQHFVLYVKGSVRDVEVNLSLNPFAEATHGYGLLSCP
jgi:hypothetical protein